MSDTTQEPTMEEILASIRRIISEDDAPQEGVVGAESAAPAHDVAETVAPDPVNETSDEVLDLTERVEETPEPAPAESVGDLDVYDRREEPAPVAPEPAYEPTPVQEMEPVRESFGVREDEGLVSSASAGAAAAAFGKLSQSVRMPSDGQSLNDVVRELLKPMLKDWLDAHLPAIVQAKVDEEVERIARGRVR
jgi:cell pole-organizing protein PopZ